ncbi:MAG: hypothetical protein ACE5NW_03745 [Acidiferrobacterales bacterium]
MFISRDSNCTIRYDTDMIVLSGEMQTIHLEADKILRRFAYSAKPYEVQTATVDRIVLAVRR